MSMSFTDRAAQALEAAAAAEAAEAVRIQGLVDQFLGIENENLVHGLTQMVPRFLGSDGEVHSGYPLSWLAVGFKSEVIGEDEKPTTVDEKGFPLYKAPKQVECSKETFSEISAAFPWGLTGKLYVQPYLTLEGELKTQYRLPTQREGQSLKTVYYGLGPSASDIILSREKDGPTYEAVLKRLEEEFFEPLASSLMNKD